MVELSEISVGDEVLENDAERGYVVVAAPERYSRPHRVRGVNDE